MQRVFSSEGCADAMVAAGHAAEQESPTARTIRMVMGEAAARERARCLGAILNWTGLTEDEKRIATMAIMAGIDAAR